MLKKIDSTEPRIVIYEGQKVSGSIHRYRNWSRDITMYQIKCGGSSSCLPNIILSLWMLPYQAAILDSLRELYERQSLNHFFRVQLLQVFEIQIVESLMPESACLIGMGQ